MRLRSLLSMLGIAAIFIMPIASDAQTPAPLTIPVIISLTGGASFIGKSDQQALNLIAEMVNKKGGVNKRPLKFQYLDDGSNAQTNDTFSAVSKRSGHVK